MRLRRTLGGAVLGLCIACSDGRGDPAYVDNARPGGNDGGRDSNPSGEGGGTSTTHNGSGGSEAGGTESGGESSGSSGASASDGGSEAGGADQGGSASGGSSSGGSEAGGTDSGGSESSGGADGGSSGSGASGSESGGGAGGTEPGPGEGGAGGVGIDPGEYPAGPYGDGSPAAGAVLENLAFEGFVNDSGTGVATSQPYRAYTFQDLRASGARYALILTAAAWCSSCKISAADLAERGHEVTEAGGAIMQILLDGTSGSVAPTQEGLTAWVNAYELTTTTVRRLDARTREVFTDREYAYIVDLETMTVLWRGAALYGNPSISVRGIEKILADYL